MALTSGQLYGLLSGAWTMALIAGIMVPYVVVTAVSPQQIWHFAAQLGFGADIGNAVTDANQDAKTVESPQRPSYADMLGVFLALVSIVLASIGLVRSAIILGAHSKIPKPVLGTILLAALTGVPNAVTGAQLALRGRGSAVLSEALNSNTLNLIAGASIPVLVLGMGTLSSRTSFSLWWMVGMTLLALGFSFAQKGLGGKGGALLMSIYAAFVLAVILGR